MKAAWWDVLADKPWLTSEVFDRSVRDMLETSAKLPTPAEFLAYCEINRDELARERARQVPVLPPPLAHAAPQIDPNDPYSCTPEERERWAREDAWIRRWNARRRTPPAEMLWRLAPDERERLEASLAADEAVARWPQLRPDQRRAKDVRTEAARLAAIKSLRDAGKDFAASLLEKIPPTYDRLTTFAGMEADASEPAPQTTPTKSTGPEWPGAAERNIR